MNTLDLLNEISKSKLVNKTDKQLAHFEKLDLYRKSQKNKDHFAAQGMKQQKYTMEQIQRIRVMFWEEGKSVTECLQYLNSTNCNTMTKYLTNVRYLDPNFKWDPTEYPRRAKEQRKRKPSALKEEHLDILNGMDMKSWTSKWGRTQNAWANQRLKLRNKGYTIVGMPKSKNKSLS